MRSNAKDNTGPIRKMLDVSTSHLPETCLDNNWPLGIIRYEYEEGYIVWVPCDPADPGNDHTEENEGEGEPFLCAYRTLRRYIVIARELDCDFIMFDRDAEEFEGFHDRQG